MADTLLAIRFFAAVVILGVNGITLYAVSKSASGGKKVHDRAIYVIWTVATIVPAVFTALCLLTW